MWPPVPAGPSSAMGHTMASSLLRETEKDVTRKVWRLLRECACEIYNTAQPRASMVSLGIPDLMAFSPLRGFAFIEVKAPNGKPSKEQKRFQLNCQLAGITYILADSPAPVRDWLGAKR